MKISVNVARSSVVFLLFLLGGCVAMNNGSLAVSQRIPEYFRNEESLKAISETGPEISLNGPLENMLYMFRDEELKKILEAALEKNPDLLILASKLNQARSQAKISFAGMFPRVGAEASYDYGGSDKTVASSSDFQISGTLSWEIDLFGKLNALRKSSEELIGYAEENLSSGRVSLLADAASYYFTIRSRAKNIEISQRILLNLKKRLEIRRQKYDLGLIPLVDVLETEQDILDEQIRINSYKNELEENLNALLVLIDASRPGFDPQSNYDLPIPNIPPVDSMPVETIMNRPDVLASIYSLNSEIYKRRSKKAELYPSLSLSANIGEILASPTGAGDLVWQILGSLTAPLLNRKELYENLNIQDEAVNQARYTLQNIVNTALGEIETWAFKTYVMEDTRKTAETFLKNSSEASSLTRSKYEHGLTDELELIDVENKAFEAERSLEIAKYDIAASSIQLYKALGGSFSPPASGKDKK